MAFTSQIQVRHLFQVADLMGCAAQLTNALNQRAVVAAVGPVCAVALRGLGVDPDIVPERPKLGPMMAALAEYIERTDAEP